MIYEMRWVQKNNDVIEIFLYNNDSGRFFSNFPAATLGDGILVIAQDLPMYGLKKGQMFFI